MKPQIKALALGILTVSLMSNSVWAENDWKGEAKDAWIDGKLEASYLLNSELNIFRIQTDVKDGNVILSGTVQTEARKDLAAEIANNLDGVGTVTNNIVVSEKGDEYATADRDFSSRFYDMTTTLSLKTKFALNKNLEAKKINVITKDGVVTLEGDVDSRADSMLAEEMAAGYDHVSKVANHLNIVASNN